MIEATLDAVLLARIQFAANISFHILFPTISIALGWALLFFKLRYRATGDERWMGAYKLWVKVFALTFALGVVSGIVMSFQFGTNWPGFMERVGNVAGPLLAYEVMTAFFLEAAFLGIMLFGIGKVSDRVHTLATLLVAAGTTLSAFFILALNSWMHTPDGHVIIDGRVHAENWVEVMFNPSFPYRLGHTLVASGLTCAFLIAGLSAWRLRRGAARADAALTLRFGIGVAALLIPLQIVLGDLHGLNTLEHQPAKVAAMEGIWQDERGAALRLFAVPDEAARTNQAEIRIPYLASLILTHSLDGEIKGLDSFQGQHPPVAPVFYAFRVMVGVGVLMLLVSWLAAWQLWRRGALSPWLGTTVVAMSFSGWIATLAGWYVTEIGRQPWLVHGILTTAEAASAVPAGAIGLTLAMYLVLYLALIAAYVGVLFRLARKADAADAGATGSVAKPVAASQAAV